MRNNSVLYEVPGHFYDIIGPLLDKRATGHFYDVLGPLEGNREIVRNDYFYDVLGPL